MTEIILDRQTYNISESTDKEPNSCVKLDSSIPCFRCGICCYKHQVRIDIVEARRICDVLGLNWHIFLSRYIDQKWPDDNSFLLRQQDQTCIFLRNTNLPYKKICLIHMFKPSACREWMPSLYQRECREGLLRYWGLSVTLEGELQGANDRIQCFQSFLKSLTAGNGLEMPEGKS